LPVNQRILKNTFAFYRLHIFSLFVGAEAGAGAAKTGGSDNTATKNKATRNRITTAKLTRSRQKLKWQKEKHLEG